MIRDDIKAALVNAMKAKDGGRVAALRLVQAAIKNRDIELRRETAAQSDDDAVICDVLAKMAKQRRESITMFEAGGRPELAARERDELDVIDTFLPAQMDADEAKAAIAALVAEAGATSIKDMGRVMALVKSRLAGSIDMSLASGLVKDALG